MSSISKVRQSIVLTTSGQLQKLNPSDGSAMNITKAQVMTVYGQASNSDAEIKIYNEVGSATAKNLIFRSVDIFFIYYISHNYSNEDFNINWKYRSWKF